MIKRRNMGMQVILMIITLGIYGIYWFYVTSKEMVEYKRLGHVPSSGVRVRHPVNVV